MNQLHRLKYVPRFYPHLQGLRLIPLGTLFLLTAAWNAGVFRWLPGTTGRGPQNWFALLFALALVAAMLLGIYYRRRFGMVRPSHRARGPLMVLAFVLALFFAAWVQDALQATVSLSLLVIGTAIGYVGLLDGLARTHYLVVSTAVLVLAMLGTFGVSPHMREVLFYGVTGIGLMVVGVGDHVLILRTLKPVSDV